MQFHKKKNAGIILTLTGSALFIGGVATFNHYDLFDDRAGVGVGMFISGFIVTSIGAVMWGTYASRIKKVRKILNNQNELSITLAPCILNNNGYQDIHPGLTLKLNF